MSNVTEHSTFKSKIMTGKREFITISHHHQHNIIITYLHKEIFLTCRF